MNGDRPQAPNDAERDAWLREALRHAPDAQLEPPAALSEFILREAQAKAKTAAPSRPRAPITSRWSAWLARPQAGAALASVMVASAVGLLWWDRPIDEHAPRPAAAWPSPDTDVATASAGGAAPAVAPAASAALPTHAPAQSPVAAKSTARSQPAPRQELATAAADQAERRAAPAAAKPAPAAREVDATNKAGRKAEAMSPPAAPAAAATALAQGTAAAEALRSAGSADLSHARQRFAAKAEVMSLEALRAALAVDGPRWAWQRDGGAPRAVDDRLTGWLARADAATRNQWRPAAEPATAAARDEAAPPAAGELALLHDARLVHRLRLDGQTLHWHIAPRDGVPAAHWRAALNPAQAGELRQRLDDATR